MFMYFYCYFMYSYCYIYVFLLLFYIFLLLCYVFLLLFYVFLLLFYVFLLSCYTFILLYYVFLLLCCVFIVMFMYPYCYVCSVLGILFYCVVPCVVCVYMCTVLLPPGVNPIAVSRYISNLLTMTHSTHVTADTVHPNHRKKFNKVQQEVQQRGCKCSLTDMTASPVWCTENDMSMK